MPPHQASLATPPSAARATSLTEVDASIGLGFVALAERLEAELGRRVDLVSRRGLKPAMWASIEPERIDVEA